MFKRANMWGQKHGHSFTTFPFCHPSQLGSEGSKEGIWKRDCTRHKHMSVGSQPLEVCLVVHSPGLAKVHYRANLSNTVCLSRYLITCLKKAKGTKSSKTGKCFRSGNPKPRAFDNPEWPLEDRALRLELWQWLKGCLLL